MIAAWITGVTGALLTLWLGTSYLGLTVSEALMTSLFSEIAAFVAAMITVRATQDQWFGANHFKGGVRTWALVSSIYFLILLGLDPPMRNLTRMAVLFFPLQIGHGFMAMVYGPIQDRIVRSRSKSS
jgi:hypothetical protein